MAKGMNRGNREVRKPKKEKKPVPLATPLGTVARPLDVGGGGKRKGGRS